MTEQIHFQTQGREQTVPTSAPTQRAGSGCPQPLSPTHLDYHPRAKQEQGLSCWRWEPETVTTPSILRWAFKFKLPDSFRASTQKQSSLWLQAAKNALNKGRQHGRLQWGGPTEEPAVEEQSISRGQSATLCPHHNEREILRNTTGQA